MTTFTLPGYDVVDLVGFGATGEVWLAREVATGEPVALKRLRVPDDLAGRDRLRREAAVLAGVAHPHLVRLRALVTADGAPVLVLDYAAGGSLAGLLAARRCLTSGEVVTVAAPIAQALAAVHARGIVHGDLSPANILFTADGRPVLSDLGVARLVGAPVPEPEGTHGFLDPAVVAGAAPGSAADVYGLGAVCYTALAGRPPDDDPLARRPLADLAPGAPVALVDAVEAALHPDPGRRPGAGELASALFDACRPAAVRLTAPATTPLDVLRDPVAPALTHRVHPAAGSAAAPDFGAPPSPGSRAPRRRGKPAGRSGDRAALARGWRAAIGALVVLAGLAMAALTGLTWAGSTTSVGPVAPPGPAGASGDRSASTSARGALPDASGLTWRKVLADLDDERSAAFARADPGALDVVYAPGSPALARDRVLLGRLVATGLTARGLRLRAASVTVVSATARRAVLRVVDVMPPYQLVATTGQVAATGAGRSRVTWLITLADVGGRWRVYDVARA